MPPLSQSSADSLSDAIDLRLAFIGYTENENRTAGDATRTAEPVFARYRELALQTREILCPSDQRVQEWLEQYCGNDIAPPLLPRKTLVLDQPGLARGLSLPRHGDRFSSDLLQSYRVRQGILHNPANDRRTTQGVFHVAEGGLPVADDKRVVPKSTFVRMLQLAFQPPAEALRLPYTSGNAVPLECFASLLMRPMVCPAIPGLDEEKSMEVRFLAPGSLISNLDFVEGIFGNAGDPYLTENDAGLDVSHWTGHTGWIILAPHLTGVLKKDVGLINWDAATARQQRDGMCWKSEYEKYNGGSAFKLAARDAAGVMITIIADNYYGYCKKEIKTQISFSANLRGYSEEEHAGGALVCPSYELDNAFFGYTGEKNYSLAGVFKKWPGVFQLQDPGHALSARFPQIVLVPETTRFSLSELKVSWNDPGRGECAIKLLASKVYVLPSGYHVRLEPTPDVPGSWRLVGTVPEPTLCHKPSTVSGGGKSEISKAINYAILTGHVFIADFEKDFQWVARILNQDTSNRFLDAQENGKDRRAILSSERSLGSVIKLLTPSHEDFSQEYNDWLGSIPPHVQELVLVLKRHYQPAWGENWLCHFSVDTINGRPGNELKLDGRKLISSNLRVGYSVDGSWRVFGLRSDFHPSIKVQVEDDITASVVVPRAVFRSELFARRHGDFREEAAHLPPRGISLKLVGNCEELLFQRPDDAIHRGYDRQAEADIASPDTFLSNYEPLVAADADRLMEDAIGFSAFSRPMQSLIAESSSAENTPPSYFVSSAHPRLVNGKPTQNPRYLQKRPDRTDQLSTSLVELCTRLHRELSPEEPLLNPVNVLVPGRRNNPEGKGIRPLAVFNPIHYLELPELFMEFISSMTGKSPSTTGAGSEGALTKGPFNALLPIVDLNAAFTSLILTGHDAFLSAAGYVGPKIRVDHDISLLIPEIFSRMTPVERDARGLIARGCLVRCEDFDFDGKRVLASRLGYRITARFVRIYFGRIFNHPDTIFTDEMLRPELQDPAQFADGMGNMVATHRSVARSYFADGSIELACPPLRALLSIMAEGDFHGENLGSPAVRKLFDRDEVIRSAWYRERLNAQRQADRDLWTRHIFYLESFLANPARAEAANRLNLKGRLISARDSLRAMDSPAYQARLQGSLGLQPRQVPAAITRTSSATNITKTAEPKSVLPVIVGASQ